MSLGEKLLDLRKEKHLSQEEVADKLNVSRQTVSKWETDQSTPDFDKIMPICELYGITTNELLTGKKTEKVPVDNLSKRALGIGLGVLGYFISIVWIMVSVAYLNINPVLAAGIFILLIGISTFIVVYTGIVYKKEKKEKESVNNSIYKQLTSVLSVFTVAIYLLISFLTNAWHITWILWIIYALVCEIIKLYFMMKGRSIDGE